MTKPKLPDDMAFPITVSDLREKLFNTPQSSEIEIVYSYVKPMSERRLQKTKYGKSRKSKAEQLNEIISASYQKSAISLTTPNSYLTEDSWMNTYTKHRWLLRLSAVPRTRLDVVRRLLDEEGYQRLVNWFDSTNKHSGSIGRHTLVISLQNERLIYSQSD